MGPAPNPRTPANPLSHLLGWNKETNHQHIAKEYIQFAAISTTPQEKLKKYLQWMMS